MSTYPVFSALLKMVIQPQIKGTVDRWGIQFGALLMGTYTISDMRKICVLENRNLTPGYDNIYGRREREKCFGSRST